MGAILLSWGLNIAEETFISTFSIISTFPEALFAFPVTGGPPWQTLSNIWLVFSSAFPAVTLPADTGDCSSNLGPTTFTEDFLFARLQIFLFLNPK